MPFSYLTKDNFKKTWSESEEYTRRLFDPFKEYERIARNRPHPKIDPAYPKVTDGTLASIIQETPKRYIQQIPTGVVEVKGGPEWLPIFANFKLQKDIIPHANCQADVLQKSWNAGSKSMTYGSQSAYVYFDNYGEYYGPNFKLPYVTDVYLEKGKLTDRESNIIFLRCYYQKRDIEAIIDKEKKLAKAAKERGEKYESTWKLDVLERIKDLEDHKEDKQRTPIDREKSVNQGGIEIIHGFQRGVGADFISWAPSVSEVVRVKKNKDPRGCIPIHFLYCNIDLSNPYGRGVVEQSGGKQNLLDGQMQAFQYTSALQYAPPVKIKGSIRRGSIKFVPNAVWDLGKDPNNDVTTVDINNAAINNFSNNYGLIKSQILNENSSLDTSVSAEVGNPGFSKTPAGVDAQQQRLGVSDNYLRKQFESWFQEVCETMLNIHFAEMSGVREEILDKSTADKIRALAPELFVSEDPEEDTILVDYDALGHEPIYFEVDATTSSAKDDAEQIENLTRLMDTLSKYGGLPPEKQMALLNKVITKFGIEDPEDVLFTKEEIEAAKEQAQMQQQQAEMQAQGGEMPMEGAMPPDQEMVDEVPEDAVIAPPAEEPMPEDPLTEDDYAFAEELVASGFSEDQAGQAIALLQSGYDEDQVKEILGEPANQLQEVM